MATYSPINNMMMIMMTGTVKQLVAQHYLCMMQNKRLRGLAVDGSGPFG